MENKRIQTLVEKYIDGSATSEEEAELMDWYRASNEREIEWPAEETNEKEALRLKMLSVIQQKAFRRAKSVRSWFRIAAAAAVLVFLSVGGYFLVHQQQNVPEKMVRNRSEGIHPGTNGAVLTLAGGQKIVLGQTKNGMVATQGHTALQKQNDSLLVYREGTTTESAQTISYNTLETPRGRQFQIVLPDGTKVWLNAASSLKYPTAFTGKVRTVELKGEAYFEVVHNDRQPFYVVTHQQVVKDIGTHFNIKAYPDEAVVKTTVLEGAVKVTLNQNQQSRLLYPGEQAIADRKIRVERVDVLAAVAWKDGKFIFRSEPIGSIMRQIARWYNVRIVYKDDVSGERVWGTVSRYAKVSEVLNMIELTGIAHFKVEGHKIIVTK